MGNLVGSTPRVVGAWLIAMGVEKAFDNEVRRWPVGSQLAAIRWCLGGGQAQPLVVQSQAAVKALMHRHPRPSVTGAILPRLSLQATAFEKHQVVRTYGASILETEDLLEDESWMGWPEN